MKVCFFVLIWIFYQKIEGKATGFTIPIYHKLNTLLKQMESSMDFIYNTYPNHDHDDQDDQ